MDLLILEQIQEHLANPFLDAVMPYFTLLGSAGALWIAIGVALLFSKQYRFWGICLLVSLACVGLFNELGIKNLVERVRPYIAHEMETLHLMPPTSYSFPSGHTGTSFAAATVIALMPIRRRWKALAWATAVLMAFSRLYLNVHYPTDVLAGAVLGVLYALAVVAVGKRVKTRWFPNGDDSLDDRAPRGKHARL